MFQHHELPRIFVLVEGRDSKETLLTDPGSHLPLPTDVSRHYAPLYPMLTSCTIEGPTIEARGMVYYFKTVLGTKG